MKIKLAVCTTDQSYASRFINYFNIHYADRTELSEFTSPKQLEEFMKISRPDICMIGNEFLEEIGESISKSSQVVILTEEQDEDIREYTTICKYQRAELIYKELLNVYADKKTGFKAFHKRNENAAVSHVFLSASGGAGATTVALAYAANLAKEKNVLYLNLQQYNNADLILKAEGTGKFDDVIFALKSKRGSLSLKLESLVRKSKENINFFVSCDNPLDLLEVTGEEIKRLIVELTTCGLYEEVIIDIDSHLGEMELAVMEEVDDIVLVEGGSASNCMKFERFHTALERLEEKRGVELVSKLLLFYNRFSNKSSTDISGKMVQVIGGIPRFEGVQMEAIVSRMSIMNCFEQLKNLRKDKE